MSPDLEKLASMAWACLQTEAKRNHLFDVYLTQENDILDTFSAASITFSPQLFDVIDAPSPPAIDFFKALPAEVQSAKLSDIWGIYVLVLAKPGNERHCIYIGSATKSRDGLRGRWNNYASGHALPLHVSRAMDDGYKIVHQGLLLWAPRPAFHTRAMTRLVFILLETVFHFCFWSMVSRTNDYKIGSCCPWKMEAFTYDGLCNHSPLGERCEGDFNLTAEEIETLEAYRKQSRREATQRYVQKNRDKVLENAQRYRQANRAKVLEIKSRYRQANRAKLLTYDRSRKESRTLKARERRKKAIEDKTYFCEVCGQAYGTAACLSAHKKTSIHMANVAAAASGEVATISS